MAAASPSRQEAGSDKQNGRHAAHDHELSAHGGAVAAAAAAAPMPNARAKPPAALLKGCTANELAIASSREETSAKAAMKLAKRTYCAMPSVCPQGGRRPLKGIAPHFHHQHRLHFKAA